MLKNRNPLRNQGVQSIIASLLCIIVGMLVGYVVLLMINAKGAGDAILAVAKNFFTFKLPKLRWKNFGNTLVKTAPLILCSLSILFAYKVGLFNIGAAGQYAVGCGAALFFALHFHSAWYICLIMAIVVGGLWGAFAGILQAFCNVNVVISGIMLNWIGLYGVNMLLTTVKEETSPYTFALTNYNRDALLPTMGLGKYFGKNDYVTIAIPLAILMAVLVWVILNKTKFGYELKATGANRNAAKYCGMKEKQNIIVTLVIAGGIAGMAAGLYYLTGFEQWKCTETSVPAMGFNGIAAAFLGNLNPIGCIFSSYFIQHITNGGAFVDKSMYCSQISDFISSLIIYLCAFVLFLKQFMNARLDARDEKKLRAMRAAEEANKEGGKVQ